MDSILQTTKKLLGIDAEYTHFDTDVIVHINTALFSLRQLGVGPEEGYVVRDQEDTWTMFVGADSDLEAIKSYIYLRVRLLFDPPNVSHARDAFDKHRQELEWRLQVQREGGPR